VWWGITSLPALSLWDWVWSLFVAGSIAIIAMILPGISGSYLLLILGKYTEVLWYVVDAVDAIVGFSFGEIPFFPLTIFVLGVILWLGGFSRLLWWVKQRYHDQMVVILIGFMLWALQTLRPRKETVSTYMDRYGVEQPLIQQNVLWPNSEALYIWIGFAALGMVLMLGIHYGTEKLKKS
jgi:putative membrane protein